ncbi:hypothetical protein V4D00_17420 [Ralstonia solanacearum]|uniref:hypothetical protein n=1 Tax=Ralstonia solanacearum TaxID=305 RepID=UPI002F91EE82
MDKLSLFLFATVPFGVVLLLKHVYQWAGVKWKRYPSIPLWLGILLLLTTFLLQWWLEGVAEANNSFVKARGAALSEVARHFVTALAAAYSRQAKFVELAVIPFAMALIGTALVLKIEKDLSSKVGDLEKLKRRC